MSNTITHDENLFGSCNPCPCNPCPHCHSPRRQTQWGRTRGGSPKRRCPACRKVYVAHPKPRGYSSHVRQEAIRLALDGHNLRAVGQRLSVSHQSVANWLQDYQRQHPQTRSSQENISS